MGIHIEISGDASPTEWDALAAFVAVMRGTTALSSVATINGPVTIVAPTPEDLQVLADEIPAGPSAAVVPPATPAEAADALIAAEENRVAALPAAASTPAAVSPPLSPPAGVELDSDGLPWDARIHASTKTKVQSNGTWKKIRKVEPELVKQVEAELRQVMAAPVPETPGMAAPVTVDGPVTTDPAAAFAAQQPAADVPPPPGADVPPPPADNVPPPPASDPPAADPAPAADLTEFARIMKVVAAKQTAGTATPEIVNQIVKQLGLTGVRDFAKRPDLIPAFEALLPG